MTGARRCEILTPPPAQQLSSECSTPARHGGSAGSRYPSLRNFGRFYVFGTWIRVDPVWPSKTNHGNPEF